MAVRGAKLAGPSRALYASYVPPKLSPTPSGEVRAEPGAALAEQIRRLDIFLCRMWQLATGFGIVGGLALAASVPGPLGITSSAVGGVLFAWFTLQASLLGRGVAPSVLPLVSYLVEGLVPW